MSLLELQQLFFQLKDDVFEYFEFGIADSKSFEKFLKSVLSSQSLDAVNYPRYVAQSSI